MAMPKISIDRTAIAIWCLLLEKELLIVPNDINLSEIMELLQVLTSKLRDPQFSGPYEVGIINRVMQTHAERCPDPCHPERSEGSLKEDAILIEILRAVYPPNPRHPRSMIRPFQTHS